MPGSGNDLVYAGAGDNYVYPSEGNDTVYGGDGDDDLADLEGPDPGDDLIFGGAGSDFLTLVGRYSGDPESGGRDTLYGGSGDDVFAIHREAADGIIHGGDGWDKLYATSSNYQYNNVAISGVEQLIILGESYFTLDQLRPFQLIAKCDVALVGAGGRFDFGARSIYDSRGYTAEAHYKLDVDGSGVTSSLDLVGTARNDTMTGSSFADTLLGAAGHDSLFGNAGTDDLRGGFGNDTIDGGADADTLTGGAGNDVYVVDSTADVIVEWVDRGIDTMQATTAGTWRIAANVENFSYCDAGSVTVTGNALDNSVLGGWGADMLSGWAGNDTLQGAAGRDRLYGNTGDDVLDGGLGADTLTGGLGADTFLLAAAPGANTIDTITDFSVADDTIRLARSAFTALRTGPLASDALLVTTPGGLFQSPSSATRLIYDSAAGTLSYDADGSGALDSILIARLSPGLVLTAGDFVVV